ncbi:hypothetical protein Dimus_005137 [Dionaea muscipula]
MFGLGGRRPTWCYSHKELRAMPGYGPCLAMSYARCSWCSSLSFASTLCHDRPRACGMPLWRGPHHPRRGVGLLCMLSVKLSSVVLLHSVIPSSSVKEKGELDVGLMLGLLFFGFGREKGSSPS